MNAPHTTLTFQKLLADGVLAPMHQAFGETIQRLNPGEHSDVVLAAVLCSEQLGRGHVCLDLPSTPEVTFLATEADLQIRQYDNWPELTAWIEHLQDSPLVTVVTTATVAESESDATHSARPLVLDIANRRLYLARYWFFEQQLARDTAMRLLKPGCEFDETQLRGDVARLFPDRDSVGSRDQCLAVASSVDRWFTVITGGPGTGKTTTVARLLALRLLQHAAAGYDPAELRILLMAPTGKAAQRLNESLGRATSGLDVTPPVRDALSQIAAGTIHRLLGWTPLPPERGGPFRHNADLPLDADLVLVDEASMVDLALMHRLFDAVPMTAQIVLIGDRDQLASVEAGGVLGDLCGTVSDAASSVAPNRFSSERRRVIAERTGLSMPDDATEVTSPGSTQLTQQPKKKTARRRKKAASKQLALPLDDGWGDDENSSSLDNSEERPRSVQSLRPGLLAESIATLSYSHRFSADSALGRLAASIRDGRADDVVTQLREADPAEILWLRSDAPHSQSEALEQTVIRAAAGYRGFLEQLAHVPAGSLDVLQAASRFRVLCAHREGASGEVSLNRRIVDRLSADGLLSAYSRDTTGRLVMVSRNDYRLNLFNGDVGVVVSSDDDSKPASGTGRGRMILLEAPAEDSGVRHVPASLVPDVQDCFAMTIHKSQGSEFHQVLLVLPEHDSPVLSRELLYTAVTRVKEQTNPENGQATPGFLCITGSESVLRAAIERRVRRASGICEAIERQLRRS